MDFGISTACFYPEYTENALLFLTENGVKTIEIFLNSFSELEAPFLRRCRRILEEGGSRAVSVHPFTSGFEPFLIFTEYERRFWDSVSFYERYFEAAAFLGASFVVFHGDRKDSAVSDETYFEKFAFLQEKAKQAGVLLVQENVAPCRSGSLEFLLRMRKALGEDVKFVLDIKQAVRRKEDPFRIAEELGESIVHFHLSDNGMKGDCLPIGKGNFPFGRFLKELSGQDSSRTAVLELYRQNYKDYSELLDSLNQLQIMGRMNIHEKICNKT